MGFDLDYVYFKDIVFTCCLFGVLNWNSESQEEELEAIAAQEQKIFSFQTLVSATKNFHPDNKLGQGGYGPVFKVPFIIPFLYLVSIKNSFIIGFI